MANAKRNRLVCDSEAIFSGQFNANDRVVIRCHLLLEVVEHCLLLVIHVFIHFSNGLVAIQEGDIVAIV